MANSGIFERSNSNTKNSLLSANSRKFSDILAEEAAIQRKVETLSVSRRLVKTFSQKFKKKNKRNDLGGFLIEERGTERPSSSSGCLSIYIKGGGCSRVGSCDEIDVNGMMKSGISEDCLPHKGGEKKHSRKMKAPEPCVSPPEVAVSLPDDVVEMILARLPLRTLIVTRLVCKKWSRMISSPQFLQLRSEMFRKTPWMFVFGLTRKGVYLGEIFALDIVEDDWHVIKNDLLKDLFLYSVASIGMDIYIVGGCSPSKTNKEVIKYSPLTGLWCEVVPMNVARSEPVVGVFEVSSSCSIFQKQENRVDQNRSRVRTRNYGVSDIYEDPYRLSLRRQLGNATNASTGSTETRRKPSKHLVKEGSDSPKFSLVVVGGVGSRNEPLDSGEIYDPTTDSWVEIARLPDDFGPVSSGTVCSWQFYIYSSVSNRLASYDLERGYWSVFQISQPPPCIRAYSPKIVSCQARVFMCCVCWSERDGQLNRGEQAVRKLWELDTEAQLWIEVSRHPDAPMDKSAGFVSDGERIYGLDMFRVFGQALDFLTACDISGNEMEWSRVTRKLAGHEACTLSSTAKSMVVLRL